MSQILTRTAYARNQANSTAPQHLPNDLTQSPDIIDSPNSPAINNPANLDLERANPSPPKGGGDPNEPDRDPDPPGDDPYDGPDGDDEDKRNEDRNLTVRELLRFLNPILADRRVPPPAAPPHRRRLKVNPPEEFDGQSPKKLKSFLVSCNNTFRADPETFGLHDKRVSYALSYLRGSAQRHFDTQLEDEEETDFIPPDWLDNWTRFVEELRGMFGDPNAESTAEAELDNLRMRTNQKFADFLVEFNTLSSQVNWGDRALHHRLKHALPDRIKDSLALVQEPDVFVDWKRLVQNIDQRYWERQADIRRDIRPSHTNNTTRNNVPPTIARNPPQSPSAVQTTTSTRGTPGNPPVASHLNAQGGLTQTERDRRIAQGLCLYCGGQGHKASECSKAHKTCEKTGRAAQTTDPPSITPLPSTTPVDPKITVAPEN